ncbi:MAG TPA: DUF4350 domain-containing protein [Candidatus Elarobacter sp.]|nr:DUF4350 domain-containing protein [Candidatus Elarobacter sp.]
MRRDLVIAALALVALAAVSVLGNRQEQPAGDTRASGDFGPTGYRGWYGLLEREGIAVERFRRHHDALGESGIDTLVVAFPSGSVPYDWNASERDALRGWVRRGGHLIDIGMTPSVDKNDLKGELVAGVDAARGPAGALHGPWSAYVHAWPQRGNERIAPLKGAHVTTLLADRGGRLVVRYRYGRGTILSVADASVFENRALARADDARLAYLAGRPSAPGRAVAFDEAVRGDVVERAWYDALNAPELVALAILALAGLLWLAYGIVSLGPAVRLTAPREPTSEEFLDAVAALYGRARARGHARDALVADARRSLERAPRSAETLALARRVDALAGEPVRDDAALLAVAQLARTARENRITMAFKRATRRLPRRAGLRDAGGAA